MLLSSRTDVDAAAVIEHAVRDAKGFRVVPPAMRRGPRVESIAGGGGGGGGRGGGGGGTPGVDSVVRDPVVAARDVAHATLSGGGGARTNSKGRLSTHGQLRGKSVVLKSPALCGCLYLSVQSSAMCLCAVLCCVVLCCSVLCCVVLCCAVLCCAVLYCVVLCCAVLCCVVLSCAVLFCVVLCFVLCYAFCYFLLCAIHVELYPKP